MALAATAGSHEHASTDVRTNSLALIRQNGERWIRVSNPHVAFPNAARCSWAGPPRPYPDRVHAGRGGRQNHGDIADTDRRLSLLTQFATQLPFLNLTGLTPAGIALELRATCSPRAPGVTGANYCYRASSDGDALLPGIVGKSSLLDFASPATTRVLTGQRQISWSRFLNSP